MARTDCYFERNKIIWKLNKNFSYDYLYLIYVIKDYNIIYVSKNYQQNSHSLSFFNIYLIFQNKVNDYVYIYGPTNIQSGIIYTLLFNILKQKIIT